jgi:hypothetical protein
VEGGGWVGEEGGGGGDEGVGVGGGGGGGGLVALPEEINGRALAHLQGRVPASERVSKSVSQ